MKGTVKASGSLMQELIVDDTPAYLLNHAVSAKYDVIAFEFYIYTDSFVLPHKLEGYQYKGHIHVEPKTTFQPFWGVEKYKNLRTGNLVYYAVSSRMMRTINVFMFGKNRKMKDARYLVRIIFHGEATPLTAEEIKGFLEILLQNYHRFTRGLVKSSVKDKRIFNMPSPCLSLVEVALDFYGGGVSYRHECFRDNLYKVRCIKRNSIKDEEAEKHTYTYDGRTLCTLLETNYISDSYRDYVYGNKHDNQVFRFEMVLRKRYLRRHAINTVDDIETTLDIVKYWTDHYFFFRFDEAKIGCYLAKHYPTLLKPILFHVNSQGLYKPFEIYDKLRIYRVNEKRIFNYPSRQILTTKWHMLDMKIQNALRILSLSGIPADRQVRIRQRDFDKLKPDNRRNRKEKEVKKAIQKLKRAGKALSFRNVAKEAGVTTKAAQRYKNLFKT